MFKEDAMQVVSVLSSKPVLLNLSLCRCQDFELVRKATAYI